MAHTPCSRSTLVSALVLLAVTQFPAASAVQAPIGASEATVPSATLGARTPQPTEQSAGAATNLSGFFLDDPVSNIVGTVRLQWTPAKRSGSEQRVMVTLREDGFHWGDYRISDVLEPGQATFDFGPLGSVRTVYWQVLTRHSAGWIASSTTTTVGTAMAITSAPATATAPVPTLPFVPGWFVGGACAPLFADINPNNSDLDPTDPDGASGGRVNGLATVPGDNTAFFAASEWGGVYRSTDSGLNWERLEGHTPVVVWDVEVNPNNAQIVYATSFFDGRTNSVSGIQVSTDGGTTWSHPASAVPNSPAAEGGPGDNTPVAGYTVIDARRTQPAAFGISVRPDAPNVVCIGTNCGLAISNDAGATWIFVDPTPESVATEVLDVVVQGPGPTGQGIIDIVSNGGHHRSTDGGLTWSVNSLPTGGRSIAVSPDESYVLFVAGTNNNLLESDDAGATWTTLGRTDPIRGGGRIPFVATNQKTVGFDLWTGGVSLYRAACTTPATPAPGGANRCPPATNPLSAGWFGGFTRGGLGAATGAHDDVGDIVFDSEDATDAVPVMFSNDGGVYFAMNTSESPTSTVDLVWEQPLRTPHGLWLFGHFGVNQPGANDEDIYFGCQDTGTFANTLAAAADPSGTWHNPDCCDTFDFGADNDTVVYTQGSFGNGRQFPTFISTRGIPGASNTQLNAYPPGGLTPAFNFDESIDVFGNDRFAMLMQNCFDNYQSDGIDNDNNGTVDDGTENNGCPGGAAGSDGGLFITLDVEAVPIVWTELGDATEPNSGQMNGVRAALSGGVPTFYVQVGGANGIGGSQLWKFVGTDPAGVWDRIDDNVPGGLGIIVFGTDRSDSARLYVAANTLAGPRMFRSLNGGATWQPDTDLDSLMQGGGTFPYQNTLGPTNFTGFGGYAQPVLIAFDPAFPNIIVAAGRDSGIFISRNGGNQWALLTDPLTSAITGIPHIPRPWFAYFDHVGTEVVDIFLGTQGFGVWRISTRIAAPSISVPGDVAFAPTCLGSSSTETMFVCNVGPPDQCAQLQVLDITSSDPQFAAIEPSSGYPVTLASGFCYPFQVVFTPTASGPQTAVLTILSNDPSSPLVQVAVTGFGGSRNITTAIADLGNFGDVCLGGFVDLDLTINNSGVCDLLINAITSSNPAFEVPSVVSFPIVVQQGTSVHIPIRFRPAVLGPAISNISIFSNDPDLPVAVIAVSGNAPPPDIVVRGSTDFGQVCPGELAEIQVNVCNNGDCDLFVTSFGFVGACPDFEILNNPFPGAVISGQCIAVTIRYTPTGVGTHTCTLRITSDDPDEAVVDREVTATTPAAVIDVHPVDIFPATVVRSVAYCVEKQPLLITNLGPCPVLIKSVTLTGLAPDPTAFEIKGLPDLPLWLLTGESLGGNGLEIWFRPSVVAYGIRANIAVTFVDNDPTLGSETTITTTVCGDGVLTGARLLLRSPDGTPLPLATRITLWKIEDPGPPLILTTIETINNVPVSTNTESCFGPFPYHREWGTEYNPILLVPGDYLIEARAIINGSLQLQKLTFTVDFCDFLPDLEIDFTDNN